MVKNKWLILISGALVCLFTGIPSSWGVFQIGVENEYALASHDTAMIFSYMLASIGVGTVVGGIIADKASPRIASFIGSVLLSLGFFLGANVPSGNAVLFYIYFSLVAGLGSGILAPSVATCVQKTFEDQKGFATGVTGFATGVSGGLLTIFIRSFLPKVGMRNIFLILSITVLAVCGISSVFLKNENVYPKTKKRDKIQRNDIEKTFILKQGKFWLAFWTSFFLVPCVQLFSPYIIEQSTKRGLPENFTVWTVAIATVFGAIGRFFMPWLSDMFGRENITITNFLILTFLCVGFLTTQNNIIWIVIYFFLVFFYAAQIAQLPSLATSLFGDENKGVNFGLIALGVSLGSIIFPLIQKGFNSLFITHIIAIASTVIGLILSIFLKISNSKG